MSVSSAQCAFPLPFVWSDLFVSQHTTPKNKDVHRGVCGVCGVCVRAKALKCCWDEQLI